MLTFRRAACDPPFTSLLSYSRTFGSFSMTCTPIFPPELHPGSSAFGHFVFPLPNTVLPSPRSRFRFCLTNRESTPTYGYVKYSIPSRAAISAFCLISTFFAPEFCFGIIASYEERLENDTPEALLAWLADLHNDRLRDTPEQIRDLEVHIVRDALAFALMQLPLEKLSQVLCAALISRRIIITSSTIESMEQFAYGLLAMFHPLIWPGVFIPVLPEVALETIYAPFHYIIGLHESLLSHTESPEMENFVLVSLDDKKIIDEVQPFKKLSSTLQKDIKNFEALVLAVGLERAFRQFLLLVISRILRVDPNDPREMVSAFDKAIAREPQKVESFESCLIGSQFVDQLMGEARAGPGSDVYSAFWGEADSPAAPLRRVTSSAAFGPTTLDALQFVREQPATGKPAGPGGGKKGGKQVLEIPPEQASDFRSKIALFAKQEGAGQLPIMGPRPPGPPTRREPALRPADSGMKPVRVMPVGMTEKEELPPPGIVRRTKSLFRRKK